MPEFVMLLLRRVRSSVSPPLVQIPPPSLPALLKATVEARSVALTPAWINIPPPSPDDVCGSPTAFWAIVEFVISRVPPLTAIPPPAP
jgi:hypothetical protein